MFALSQKLRRQSCLFFIAGLSGLALLASSEYALAADGKKEGKEQARRLQQMQQKMGALEQEKSQLDGKLKEVSDELAQTRQSVATAKRSATLASQKQASLESELKAAQDEVTVLTGKLDAAQKEIATTKKTLADTQDTLRQSEDAMRRLETTLKMRSEALAACDTKNVSLYRTGGALIKKYQEKGCFDSFLQSEPVTQLGSVDVENQVEEYRLQLEQGRTSQRLEDAENHKRQRAEADRRAIEKADQELAEQKRIEQEKLQRLKAKQQGDLDKFTRKLSNLFKDIEW